MGEKPFSMIIAPDPLAALDKTVSASFDLGSIDLDALESGSGLPVKALLAPLLDQWRRAGLIDIQGSWLELTLAGQFWHVNLAQLMIDFLHQNLSREWMR
jgi:oxygen-independent coproporphyrinogen-3 oxidase